MALSCRGLRKDCQMLLFSATYEEEVMRFAQAVIPNNPIVIRLRREEQSLDNIKQYFIECADAEGKFQALSNIYGSISIGQSMIFCAVSSLFMHSSKVYYLFNMYVVFLDEFKHKFMCALVM